MKGRGLQGIFGRFLRDRRGATAAVMALMLVPLIGAVGMAVEGGGWYVVHRAAQNAADAAALAAAINGCEPEDDCDDVKLGATYAEEAAAVAAQYGFVDDADTDIATTMVDCPPTGDPGCYQTVITKRYPISLLRVVGFNGDATVDGQAAQTIQAVAIAMPPEASNKGACISSLASGKSLNFNGVPGAAISGCDFLSNGSVQCNGNETGWVDINIFSTGEVKNCPGDGETISSFTDPYDALSSKIPTVPTPTSCASLSATWTGTKICTAGTAKLGNNINLSSGDHILVVNGQFDTNGKTIQTTGTASLTIIINGPTGSNQGLIANSFGTIDIKAPTSGDFSGVAIMGKKGMTGTANQKTLNLTGNKPVVKVQGLIYVPSGDVNITGAIDKATGGLICIAIVAQNVTIGGGGYILTAADQAAGATSQCEDAGLTPPTIPGSIVRETLVQ